jgi:hypothetical protein
MTKLLEFRLKAKTIQLIIVKFEPGNGVIAPRRWALSIAVFFSASWKMSKIKKLEKNEILIKGKLEFIYLDVIFSSTITF